RAERAGSVECLPDGAGGPHQHRLRRRPLGHGRGDHPRSPRDRRPAASRALPEGPPHSQLRRVESAIMSPGVTAMSDPLNAPAAEDRLAALRQHALRGTSAWNPPAGREVNCHVHTIYSFSPYSPAAAAARARDAGLAAVGIMDHDSIAGAGEMREAGRILRLS